MLKSLCYNNLAGYPGVAQLGSALEWGSRGRRFNSCHSDHPKVKTRLKIFSLVLTSFFSGTIIRRYYRQNNHVATKGATRLQDFLPVQK